MQATACSGSEYFNYKKAHSIVLLAACNSRYEFTMADIGDASRQSGGGVYKNCQLGHAIERNTIDRPPPSPMKYSEKVYPYVFVADDAFQMKPFLLEPYARIDADISKTVFNYRLSRARRIIENCFGIAAARFRIFERPIIARVEKVIASKRAVVSLHNYLMKTQNKFGGLRYSPPGFTNKDNSEEIHYGKWRNETEPDTGVLPLGYNGSHNYSRDANEVQNDFMTYLNSEGAVSWQLQHVNRMIDPIDL